MERESSMSYDEALIKIEGIVRELESAEALSVAVYKEKAEQAKQLLDYCESCLKDMTRDYSSEK